MDILEFDNVSKSFGEGAERTDVLKNVNLKVEEGEFLVLLGFSGTGKTTLVNLMAGLEMPSRGEVRFKGKRITGPGPERGVIFQNYSLMPWLTVDANVGLAVDTIFPNLSRKERQEKVDHYVQMVGLAHAKARRPAELSGGMRQRVNVARALAMNPEMLLLDEPLSALDALTRANLADEIEHIWEADKKTCVLITNDVDEAIVLADRIIALNPDGTLGEEFKVTIPRPRDRGAMNHDPEFKRLRAGVTNYLMDVGMQAKAEGKRLLPDVVPLHALPKAVSEAARSALEDKYLEYSQLHKIYPTPKGPLTVVEDFNLTLKKGEFVSLIGHSGCGKSTVLTMTAGLNDVSKGGIKLDGFEVKGADPERAVVFQSPSLFPWLTARENVAVGVDKVYPKASRAERQDVIDYYLERVGLGDAMDKPASEMSNGMRQRVGIARAFALSPKLLLLDEPFGMLDSLTRWELQEVLMEVWSRTKVTAVCVTHDVDEAILLADRVVMMTNGPRATIGKITEVDLPRPRTRKALLEHPDYYTYREEILNFLEEYEHGAHKKKDAA
ncbi:MAG: ABC transporter ATP-binding protein [Rhodobacteraceae bacterium]|uniref:Nitrate/sulfonate/bicarbonate ABC transporter ATP-binding protein n=1 Tax=Thioclava marina TaxID=1915077 RepID=A0ABX3MHM1_9RHOB|nr:MULTISPECIES: ABC transporter ATP-binding protein [Thioclava]TNE93361.1 MAG: ABC transporter ATP-binding protein [Paracoccaceae bacterium]MBD3803230.1 ABC transporter ATP-binding protein [Thioclava sp.]OOY11009.1 nitrate/sulfonate/bicarbonate ABC transporter ATP-binding protein [Thioclava marina]OOY27309.1 nitrate/sulfonate/bicarbonate ABC transporter ATP-binding protein [Thioclava sp. L04-15]TNF14958.1 MAG: ABC transporter ATP-binding protein [Paracoccaceae bacterium]